MQNLTLLRLIKQDAIMLRSCSFQKPTVGLARDTNNVINLNADDDVIMRSYGIDQTKFPVRVLVYQIGQ